MDIEEEIILLKEKIIKLEIKHLEYVSNTEIKLLEIIKQIESQANQTYYQLELIHALRECLIKK